MENGNLPKTEQELNDLIASKVKEETDKLVAKHNGEMATMRQKHDAELKKAKDQANLTAEEIAQEKIREQQEADQKELAELRNFKKVSVLSEKLKKEGLPDFFKNDNRLLTSEEGNVDKVIKDIKKEYEAIQPKGATHSTVVNVQNQQNQQEGDAKAKAIASMGDALKEIIS